MNNTTKRRITKPKARLSVPRFDLEEVVDGLKNGFYVSDIEGNISFANHAFAQMLGYGTKDEIVGLNMAENLYQRKEDRDEFLKKLSQKGHVSDYTINMVGKDGSSITISVKSSYINDKDGKPVGVRGIVEEVAEETTGKKKERALPDLPSFEDKSALDFQHMIIDPLTGLYSYPYFMT
ncbi:MAG: PAS domain-containing protein, partial [Candidatus Omnitrophica bacterium]|nr:PAS domain-containing protein [Candidatus Omnitrophota bacterium]